MYTNNMPNYMANLQRQGVSPAERSRMAQVLGNCAQPLSHRGGMNVGGASHFVNNGGDIYNGGSTYNYRGGDLTNNMFDNTSFNNMFADNSVSQDFYDQRSFLQDFSQKTWNTHEYGDIINNLEMYMQNYENVYNEGDVTNHYNDNRIWDQRQFSQTTFNDFSTHIQHGDTFSFPTTNEFVTEQFFNGPTIINEGDVINKRLVINEGDTIINEGDTTVTYEGDSYEQHYHAGDVVNNTYNTRNTFVYPKYTTEENHFHQQVNQFITQYIYSPTFINQVIQILNSPQLIPFLQVGPFMDCNQLYISEDIETDANIPDRPDAALKNSGQAVGNVPARTLTGTVNGDSNCQVSVNLPSIPLTLNIQGQTSAPKTTTPEPINFTVDADVFGASCSMVSGVGLTQGAGSLPQRN
tara:strand:+ start:337 stop:1563 length:1227 start_codon:yes stop_codon:yes gene_type:complete